MITIDIFVLWRKFIGNINTQQGGHVKPHENFLSWCNDISKDMFQSKFAGQWEKSQKVDDDIARPFLKTVNIPVINGVAGYPEDYGHFSAARISYRKKDKKVGFRPDVPFLDECGKEIKEKSCPKYIDEEIYEIIKTQADTEAKAKSIDEVSEDEFGEKTIDKIDNGRWGAKNEHRFQRPTLQNPAITQFDGGWKVAPSGIKNIILDYLRKPKEATFNYIVIPGDPVTGQGDVIQYNPANSQALEWDELVINEFLTLLEKKYGKFIREDFIWQTSESDRKTTL